MKVLCIGEEEIRVQWRLKNMSFCIPNRISNEDCPRIKRSRTGRIVGCQGYIKARSFDGQTVVNHCKHDNNWSIQLQARL